VKAQLDTAVAAAYASPDDAAATGRLGMVLHAYQQLDVAELCYRRAHLMDPKTFSWAYYLAVVEETRGEISNAIDDARAAVRLDSSSRAAGSLLANALISSHEYIESRKLYEKLIQEEPDRALYYYGLGKVLAAQGSTVFDAIPQLKKAIQLAPNFAAAHYQLAMVYRQTKDSEQYNRELALYQKDPNSAPPDDAPMAQIKALNVAGANDLMRPEETVRELETAVADDPGDEIAHASLVKVYWQLKQYDKAEDHYRQAERLDKAAAPDEIFGAIMLERKRYTEAAEAFRRALAKNPKNADTILQLGRVYEAQRDVKDAIDQYQTAIGLEPDSREANGLLGEALLKDNQTQPAIEHLLKAVPPAGANEYTLTLAEAYGKAGDANKAKYYLQASGASGKTLPTGSSPER
jgi:tetratricopeptide (TPR) repeat protein